MRIVIAEDEAVIARRVARLTTDILGPLTHVAIAPSVGAVRDAIAAGAPDLLLLDLNLEGRDGFELLRDPILRRCQTIVVSAHTDRALEAYELGVRDFVPKPFGRARMELALHRAFASSPRTPQQFGIRCGSETRFVALDDIIYVRASGARSEVVLASRTMADDRLLDRIESVLPPHFERVHKSFVVNLRRVDALLALTGSRYALKLTDGATLPVGRTRVSVLRERLAWTADFSRPDRRL